MSLYPSFMNYRLLKEQCDDYQERMLHCLYRHDMDGYYRWKSYYVAIAEDMKKVGVYIDSHYPTNRTNSQSIDHSAN